MPEAVKSLPLALIAIIAFVVFVFIVFAIWYMGLGNGLCVYVGKELVSIGSVFGFFTSLTDIGVEAGCSGFRV
jgi:hypothetical protein